MKSILSSLLSAGAACGLLLTTSAAMAQVVVTNLHSFSVLPNGGQPQTALVLGSDGNYYGTTSSGGITNNGTVFKITPNGVSTRLYSFTGLNDGYAPNGLVQGNDGNFYGTTADGGTNSSGTVFKITPKGVLTILYAFAYSDGANPQCALVLGKDGNFYGTTPSGGTNGYGTVFKITPKGALTSFHSFTGGDDGSFPRAALAQGPDGSFYGTASYGGYFTNGNVFKITAGGVLTTLYSFSGGSDGGSPSSGLALGRDGNWYGTTTSGGQDYNGTVFMVTPGGTFTSLYSFTGGDDGSSPQSALVLGTDGNFYGTANYAGTGGSGTVFQITTNGALTSLYSFTGAYDGGNPVAALVQGKGGLFYGATMTGGTNHNGTVFQITASGALTSLYSFPGDADGESPNALVKGTDGNFYGTTAAGGANASGTVFKMTTNGALTTLYSFTGTYDGGNPAAALVQGKDGNFYGSTSNDGTNGNGAIFRITTNGTLTELYSFSYFDGAYPSAALVQATDGYLYGTAQDGGTNDDGTIFRITTNGTLTELYSFSYFDGANPSAALVQATDGNFYGTTQYGGTNGDGTVFRITTNGTLTELYSFSYFDGANPSTTLVQATDGYLYGTTQDGGTNGDGTIFQITTNGTLTVLYSFRYFDGANPSAALVQATDGNLYGTTQYGGANGDGAIFQITTNGLLTTLYSFPGSSGGNYYGNSGLAHGVDHNLYGTADEGGAGGNGFVYRLFSGPSWASQPPALLHQWVDSSLSLTAIASGLPSLTYQWQYNGADLADGAFIAGSSSSNLVISPLSLANAGTYRLIVTNYFGAVTSAVTVLTVSNDPPPTIVIESPGPGERTSSSIVTGMAFDDVGVTNVSVWLTNLNGGTHTTNGDATLLDAESVVTNGNLEFVAQATNMAWSFNLSNYPGTNFIAVQSWNRLGVSSPVVTRTLFYKVPCLLNLSHFGQGTITGAASARSDEPPTDGALLNVGEAYTLVATPATGWYFTGWTSGDSVVSANTTLNFTAEGANNNFEASTNFQANFAEYPLFAMAGTYNGLFSSYNLGPTEETAGMIANLTVKTNGVYTGQLLLAGSNYSLSGQFSSVTLQTTNHVPRPAAKGGTVTVSLGLQQGYLPEHYVFGSVSGTNTVLGGNGPGWNSGNLLLVLSVNPANPTNGVNAYNQYNLTNDASAYTMLIPPVTNQEAVSSPPGYGYGLLANHAWIATITGAVSDGSNFSQTVPITEDNSIPLYANLDKGTGLLFGWLYLNAGQYSTVPAGNLTWIRKASPTGVYPAGFTNQSTVMGSTWSNSAAHQPAITLVGGQLELAGGSLSSNLVFTNVTVTSANAIVKSGAPADSLTGSITTKTGAFTITFGNEKGKGTTTGSGAILQNMNSGGGFFPGVTNAGLILLSP